MHGGAAGVSSDADERTPPRRIVRRVGLPSGRAVVGAMLITVSVIGLFVANQRAQRAPTTTYAVVTTTVPAGTAIEAIHLRAMPMDLPDDVGARSVARIDDAVGAIAVETLHPGQLLSAAALLAPTDPTAGDGGSFEVSLALDRSRALDSRAASRRTGRCDRHARQRRTCLHPRGRRPRPHHRAVRAAATIC